MEETRQDIDQAVRAESLWARYGNRLVMVSLVAYIIVLFIGVVAEVFNIQSVLDWWLWRPPGKRP